MDLLQTIQDVLADPFQYAAAWKKRNKGAVVGTFCSYAPEEIVLAAGALPFRLFASGDPVCQADRHLQAYCCGLVRGALEDALTGRLDFLDGTVFAHTCDSMARLSDIWRLSGRFAVHLDVALPAKLDTQSARDYLAATLADFRSDLELALQTEISHQALVDAAAVQSRIRAGLRRLYRLRCENPGRLKGSDLHGVAKASMIMDRWHIADLIETLADGLESFPAPPPVTAKRILLAGGFCSTPDLHDMIEEAGGAVVWDDLCIGGRALEQESDPALEPLADMAARYAQRVVCPAKHRGLTGRAEHLIEKVRDIRADGVIYMHLKFCDPHAFDTPYLKQALADAGIPFLLLEMEDRRGISGQLQTRCQAFLEMI
jgi:bzd-type benzoyl-CoA reductase N subunit